MQLTKVKCPDYQVWLKCPYSMTPSRIVVHNTANDASAMAEISYMLGNSNEVSFHYAVDDYRVVQGIEENRNGWHAGDGNGKGNREGIAIEICYSKSGGDRFIKAEQNAVELIVDILNRYGWGIDRVTKHQDYMNKYCPHRTLDMGWDRFIKMIQDKLNNTPTPAQSAPSSQPSTSSTKKIYLPASANSWRVYPLDKAPYVGNECGFLRPSKFGGLTYDIIRMVNDYVAVIKTRDYGTVQIYVAPDTGAVIKSSESVKPTQSSATSTKKLYLPASANSWRVYPLDKAPYIGNECGFLRPSKFGGLTYDIIRYVNDSVVVIKTRDYGTVQIYVAPDTGAVIK